MGEFESFFFAVIPRGLRVLTGRALSASRLTTTAYVLLTFGVLVRVFGSAIWPHHYPAVLIVAGCAWTLSFLLFVILYTPILAGPRADGKPG
jgi:uncharacterized protein involved in response to NO